MKKHDFGKPLCRLITAVAIMMLSLQAMAYDFSYTHQGETLYYNRTSNSTVAVTYYWPISSRNNYVSGDVVIPSTVTRNGTTYRVTSIGERAFNGCSGLTSVTIPNSVTSIEMGAFNDCSRLTSVTIPNSVTSIGDGAFFGCSGLTSVTIPTGVTSIGSSAFRGCRGLTSLTIGIGVTSIGDYAFSGCSGLTTLNFNAINCYYSFSGTSLTTVNIGDSVQRIPANFVRGCSGLTSVTIGNSVTSIGGSAFSYCSGLTSVTIPNSVTSIGNSAFSGCSGLTSVNIGNSVTSIEDSAFYGCSGLTTLNFNAIDCQDFGSSTFRGTSLTTVNIGDSVQRIPANFVRGCSSLTSVTIGNNVTSIGGSAFSGCSGLTTLNFNAINCQDFEDSYFNGNYGGSFGNSLTTVNIGDSVQRIPAHFVKFCRGLTSVTIPNGVTSIGEKAFEGCRGLTSVTIPNSVTSIGVGAFSRCSGLTSINVASGNTHYSSIDGVLYNYVQDTLIQCPGAKTSVTIPNSVTSIGEEAFYGCSGLTSVTIPNSVTSIGNSAFYGCSGLTSVTIGNNVTSIGGGAFENCSGLTSVTIPNSVTSIGGSAFSGCSGLTSVRCLASAPPSIGSSSFSGISSTCTLTVSCVSLDAYIGSDWNTYFGGRILEDSTEEFSFEVIASANDLAMGSVDISIGERCDQRILTATPESCYRFNAWSDGNRNNPRIITLTQDTAFIAYFDRAVYTQEIRQTICEGTTYTENGFIANKAGTYAHTLQTVNGCDSIVILTLTVNPTYNITIDASINEGETYAENGFSESEAGTYVHTLQSEFGCDSVITLNLTVNSSLNDVVANAVEIRLYPNPAKSFVNMELSGEASETMVQLFDIQGKILRTYTLKNGKKSLRMELDGLPAACYYLHVISDNRVVVKKIIKNN